MGTIQELKFNSFKIQTGTLTESGHPVIVCGGPRPHSFETIREYIGPDGVMRIEAFSAAMVACRRPYESCIGCPAAVIPQQ